MFCVTVTPTSRTLAKVDLLNAARTGDLVELCLDHLIKEPDFSDLLSDVGKPVLISCRRTADGGQYEGSEADRVMLLKRAIVAGPQYIELDADIADQVPRFGEVQRVIAFTETGRPHADPESLLDEARGLNADVVKFSWPMRTLEEGWPLLKLVAGKRSTPVVGMGVGRSEVTFSLLSRRYGAPWVYAALERGMEAHEGQPTITELRERYAAQDVATKTNFVAVTGFGDSSLVTVETLNDAFRRVDMNVRCLPVAAEDAASFPKRMDALKVRAVLAQGPTRPVAASLAADGREADVFLKKDGGWKGFGTLAKAATKALDEKLEGQWPRKSTLVLGTSSVAASVAKEAASRGGVVSVCSPDDKAAAALAKEVDCRHVPFQALYGTLADVLIVADPSLQIGDGRKQIRPGYLRPENTVADLTDPPCDSPLTTEARERGCDLVDPLATFRQHLRASFRTLSGGKDLPEESWQLATERVEAGRADRPEIV